MPLLEVLKVCMKGLTVLVPLRATDKRKPAEVSFLSGEVTARQSLALYLGICLFFAVKSHSLNTRPSYELVIVLLIEK